MFLSVFGVESSTHSVQARHSLETGTLLTSTTFASLSTAVVATAQTGMVFEDGLQQLVATVLELVDHTIVQGILVLLQPIGDVVGHSAGIMDNGKVSLLLARLGWLGLLEVGRLAQVVGLQLLFQSLVRSFGEHRLLFKDGQDTHGLVDGEENIRRGIKRENSKVYLFDQLDTGQQVHTEIDKVPFDTLASVLLLLQHEHVMVEELLQLFVGEIDAQLFKTVEVKDFETGNIQYTDEVLTLLLCVQGFVQLLHHPLEGSVEHGLGQSTDGVRDLRGATTLGDELVTDLDPGLGQVLVQVGSVQAQQVGHTFALLHAIGFALFLAGTLLELHAANVHDRGGDLVNVVLLLLSEAEHIEGFLFGFHKKHKRVSKCFGTNKRNMQTQVKL